MLRKLRVYSKQPKWEGAGRMFGVKATIPLGGKRGTNRVAAPAMSRSSSQTQRSRYHR